MKEKINNMVSKTKDFVKAHPEVITGLTIAGVVVVMTATYSMNMKSQLDLSEAVLNDMITSYNRGLDDGAKFILKQTTK